MVESPSSVVTMTVGPVDEFHVVPPEGWVMIPLGRKWGFVHCVVSADGNDGFSAASLRVSYKEVRELKEYRGQRSGDHFVIDIRKSRDQSLGGAQGDENVTDGQVLPDRLIAGERAYGHEYLHAKDGVPQRFQKWFIGRHDGLWTITLVSAPGETVVPAEAVAALDTIEWIPVGDTASSVSPVPTAEES
ncbi:hypothetical protein [Arachnia propionica]|uniref:hypothetical protein n=1 Tax=Arachnia propionica TaxID=1750 RepID=UPI0028E68823|nr:hypothetical protein [Arachnia propionica]